MIHLFTLKGGLRDSVQPEARKDKAEGRPHGQKPEICRSEQSGQDDRGNHLDGESQALRDHRDPSSADGKAPEPVAVRPVPKSAARVEGSHLSVRCGASGTAVTASRKAIHTGWSSLNACSVRLYIAATTKYASLSPFV